MGEKCHYIRLDETVVIQGPYFSRKERIRPAAQRRLLGPKLLAKRQTRARNQSMRRQVKMY
jgi:hypothetical protein